MQSTYRKEGGQERPEAPNRGKKLRYQQLRYSMRSGVGIMTKNEKEVQYEKQGSPAGKRKQNHHRFKTHTCPRRTHEFHRQHRRQKKTIRKVGHKVVNSNQRGN